MTRQTKTIDDKKIFKINVQVRPRQVALNILSGLINAGKISETSHDDV